MIALALGYGASFGSSSILYPSLEAISLISALKLFLIYLIDPKVQATYHGGKVSSELLNVLTTHLQCCPKISDLIILINTLVVNWFIHSFIHSVSQWYFTSRARKLKFWDNIHTTSCVTCHLLHVPYQMSPKKKKKKKKKVV